MDLICIFFFFNFRISSEMLWVWSNFTDNAALFRIEQFNWRKWPFLLQGCKDGSHAVWIKAVASVVSFH